jgi:hypothetical protein
MKHLTHLIILCSSVLLFSCGNNIKTKEPAAAQPPVPEALQENSIDYSISKRSGGSDLVQELYAELAERDPELKAFEDDSYKAMSGPKEGEDLNNFRSKNNRYYRSAESHAHYISDSVLRKAIVALIKSSAKKDSISNVPYDKLLERINKNSVSIQDHKNVLMIVSTLPLIEDYQKNNRPAPLPWQKYAKAQEDLIMKIKKKTPAF